MEGFQHKDAICVWHAAQEDLPHRLVRQPRPGIDSCRTDDSPMRFAIVRQLGEAAGNDPLPRIPFAL